MHKLLKRQLKRLYGVGEYPKEIAALVELVEKTYDQFDEDREMLDRSLRLSSQELVQRNSEVRAVLRAFPDTFIWVNPWGTILDCRRGVQDETDFDPTAWRGKTLYDLPIIGDREHSEKALKAAVRAREASVIEYPVVIEGVRLFYEARFVPLVDEQALVILRDITLRKHNEVELLRYKDDLEKLVDERTVALRKARDAAQIANVGKGEFLANMSHEIRTPLNGVMGMLQLAQSTELDGEQSGYVDTALTSCRNLMRIINDVLDFSKIEAGRLEVLKEPFSVRDMVTPVEGVMRTLATEKGLEFTILVDAVSERYLGDEGRLRQVLFNLVGNAVKFTGQGEVAVEVWAFQFDSDVHRLVISVSDTGIGIPEDRIEYLFEAFTQADGSYSRNYQGTGLGLGIVKRLIELMGGQIAVESEVGVGTTVYCTVSVTPCEDKPSYIIDPGPQCTLEALSVLLVEDDQVSRLMAASLLKKMGHKVTTAVNGQEALNALNLEKFDGVLMDIQMPVMNGLEAMEYIREHHAETPVVALTAHVMESDRKRFLDAGMVDCLTKPFELDEVLEVLGRWAIRG